MKNKPAKEFYDFMQYIYEYFNDELFYSELPNCMIVITRRKRTLGYFSHSRWINNENIKCLSRTLPQD